LYATEISSTIVSEGTRCNGQQLSDCKELISF
jgi:hypothetical protein